MNSGKKLLERVNKSETHIFKNISPSKDNWITAGVGMSGLGLNFVISKDHCRSELYISRGITEENKYIFDELYSKKEQIEADFGGEFLWERLDDKKSCRIRYALEGVSCYDTEEWDKIMSFLIDGMIRMEKALINPLKAINQKLKQRGIE